MERYISSLAVSRWPGASVLLCGGSWKVQIQGRIPLLPSSSSVTGSCHVKSEQVPYQSIWNAPVLKVKGDMSRLILLICVITVKGFML